MRYYIDASAAGKLLRAEAETRAMRVFLNGLGEGDEILSSVLLETELRRLAGRESIPQANVTTLLTRISLVHPERDHFHLAGLVGGPHLRTLDALHLITAIMAEVAVVVVYDQRLSEAAVATGFSVVSPR